VISALGGGGASMVESIALVIFGLITGGLAARKGYNFFLWFFACGIIGLIILAFLPFTNKGDLQPGVAAQKRATGNTIGGVLTAIAIGVIILRIAAALVNW
jgi:peptidoglycan/LPS O-acetylase OafA/YrhL